MTRKSEIEVQRSPTDPLRPYSSACKVNSPPSHIIMMLPRREHHSRITHSTLNEVLGCIGGDTSEWRRQDNLECHLHGLQWFFEVFSVGKNMVGYLTIGLRHCIQDAAAARHESS